MNRREFNLSMALGATSAVIPVNIFASQFKPEVKPTENEYKMLITESFTERKVENYRSKSCFLPDGQWELSDNNPNSSTFTYWRRQGEISLFSQFFENQPNDMMDENCADELHHRFADNMLATLKYNRNFNFSFSLCQRINPTGFLKIDEIDKCHLICDKCHYPHYYSHPLCNNLVYYKICKTWSYYYSNDMYENLVLKNLLTPNRVNCWKFSMEIQQTYDDLCFEMCHSTKISFPNWSSPYIK